MVTTTFEFNSYFLSGRIGSFWQAQIYRKYKIEILILVHPKLIFQAYEV